MKRKIPGTGNRGRNGYSWEPTKYSKYIIVILLLELFGRTFRSPPHTYTHTLLRILVEAFVGCLYFEVQ